MLECLIHSSSSSNFEVSAGKYTSLLLLILRIISKGDYYNWLEFYFEILNYNIQGLVFWAVLFGFFFCLVWFFVVLLGIFFAMYSKLPILEDSSVFLEPLLVDGCESLN